MSITGDEGGEAAGLSPSFRFEHASGDAPKARFAVLKTRSLFKSASAGPRYTTDGFTMQKRLPEPGEVLESSRFGFTVTKKIGTSVVRNRIRRRLREAVAAAASDLPQTPLDLVIVAREASLALPFDRLVADIIRASGILATRDRPSRSRSSSQR